MNIKTLAAVVVAVAGSLGAGLAQAQPDVRWSVSIGLPPLPFPVYVQPAAVYVDPAPVHVHPAVVYGPRYATRWDRDGDGIPNRYDRYDNRYGSRYDNRYDARFDRFDRFDRNDRHDRRHDSRVEHWGHDRDHNSADRRDHRADERRGR